MCDLCPDEDDPQLDSEYDARFARVLFGHFTAGAAMEAVVEFSGCGGMYSPGEIVLYRKEQGRWRKLWVTFGQLQLDLSKLDRNPGQVDLLVGLEGPRDRGFIFFTRTIYKLTENRDPTKEFVTRQELYSFFDSRHCCGEPSTAMEESSEIVDIDGDGVKDLRVTIKGQLNSTSVCTEKSGKTPRPLS